MTTFPLLNLPPSISDRILRRLTYSEIFDLSQCSKRTFNVLKDFSLKRRAGFLVYIEPSPSFQMFSPNGEQISWVMYHNRDPKIMDLENPQTYWIPGCAPMNFCVTQTTPRAVEYGCTSRHGIEDVLKLAEYVLALFNGSVSLLTIDCDQMKYLDGLLSIDQFRRCEELKTGHGKVTHEELRQILEGFTSEQKILMCETKNNFTFAQPLQCSAFVTYAGSWINHRMLQNHGCKTIKIYQSTLHNQSIKKLLRSWVEGSHEKLEYMLLKTPDWPKESKWDISKIVEGIPSTPGVPKRQDATNFRIYQLTIPYENGVDLRRADGTRATAVVFMDNYRTQHFLFVVWQVPNPDLVVVG